MALNMPDVIGVDYLMPDLNGIDFLEMLRGVGRFGGVCNTPLRNADKGKERVGGVDNIRDVCNTPLRNNISKQRDVSTRCPKVIFFSGALSDRLAAEALRAGAAACLAKPFGIEELKAMVAKVLKM